MREAEGLQTGVLAAALSDVHPAYQAKYREPLVHWEMDEAETAADFSVPIRITPRRVRVG